MKNILKFIMVTVLVAVSLTAVAFAAVDADHAEMVLDIAPIDGQTNLYELTATCSAISTMQTVELRFTFDTSVLTPMNASTYKKIASSKLYKQSVQALNDTEMDYPFNLSITQFTDMGDGIYDADIVCAADIDVRDYYQYEDFVIFRVVFQSTDEAVAALTADQFAVSYAFISIQNDEAGIENKRYGYNYPETVPGTVDLVNNVVVAGGEEEETPVIENKETAVEEGCPVFSVNFSTIVADEYGFVGTARNENGVAEGDFTLADGDKVVSAAVVDFEADKDARAWVTGVPAGAAIAVRAYYVIDGETVYGGIMEYTFEG